VLLVGNPNVGKSVIFSYLTGRYAVASNYPGTTVEVMRGLSGHRRPFEVIDTPGVNSLFPRSEDERVTRDIILSNPDAAVVQVADAKNLFRALLLTSQLAEIGRRVILVLNMMDEARQRGHSIDLKTLSEALGIEVIETVAVEKRGLSRLSTALQNDAARVPMVDIGYPDRIVRAIDETAADLGPANRLGSFGALSFIGGDSSLFDRTAGGPPSSATARLAERQRRFHEPLGYLVASARKDWAEGMIAQAVIRDEPGESRTAPALAPLLPAAVLAVLTALGWILFGRRALADAGLLPTLPLIVAAVAVSAVIGARRLDRLTLHRLAGPLILVFILYIVFMLVGVFAAGTLVGLLEEGLFGAHVVPFVERLVPHGFVHDLLVGQYGLVSMGLTYSLSIVLPIVIVFFAVFGVLEDTGYFPRLTVLTNNALKKVGVNGKATLPIVLGFGCVTMAVLATRILETRRERVIAITLLSLAIPCSAQLGVILALLTAVSTGAVLVIAGIITAEFVVVGHLLGRFMPGAPPDFMIELPPLRAPRAGNIFRKTRARGAWFLREALPFFIAATLVLFILDKTGGIALIHRLVEPVVSRFLGLPVETAEAFIIGFFRRDYGAAGLFRLWQAGALAGNQIVVALVVMSLFMPCLATVIVTIKEIGLRAATAVFLFVLCLSVLTGGALNILLRLTGIQL
jgi:ferrous iron transport protein B